MQVDTNKAINDIKSGKLSLGIELGSTRIKAVLIDEDYKVISKASFTWSDKYENGFWTYDLDLINKGIKEAYKSLKEDTYKKYNTKITKVASIGISAMMHGYLVFDKDGDLLTPFRTWRNTYTEDARKFLTELFNFNIPHRWSIANLYQSMLNKEAYIPQIDYMTTLSGYIHRMLTGNKVLGIGDCSGMFPIDSSKNTYNEEMIKKFNDLDLVKENGIKIDQILPKIMVAGEDAGRLTKEGALFLDPEGDLEAGAVCCPPEGDAGTGMTATNTISKRTGNISVGTSIFSMIVLEKELNKYYEEIDMVTTPDGKPVAMVHCNNGTSDFDAWLTLFEEFAKDFSLDLSDKGKFYEYIYEKALEADLDAGGLITYNYLSGEPITGVLRGRPIVMRKENSRLNLANFVLSHLYSILATVRIGQDILTEKENVVIDEMLAHGGVFNTKGVMQNVTSAALDLPVAVYGSAGEGGARGIAILASYVVNKEKDESLDNYLTEKVFAKTHSKEVVRAKKELKEGFDKFLDRYKKAIEVQKIAEEVYL
jgi:sugar (pentulose or hexulose) kinase